MQHIFIVGSKGIPGAYGGYETFVDKLTEYHQNHPQLRYHVACKDTENKEEIYHNARCFHIKVPNIGAAQAIWYDVAALRACVKYIKANRIKKPIVYILACRIGPFMGYFVRQIHKLGGVCYVNPDGHEWLRAKWPAPVRKYWKISEQMMVKRADLLVCDSKNIEKYIQESYARYNPKTTFIAYGAETRTSKLADDDKKLLNWYESKGLEAKSYYLVVGRFVPENNYETMIREFMASKTERSFAIITNVNDKFLEENGERVEKLWANVAENGESTFPNPPCLIVVAEWRGARRAERQSLAHLMENMWLKATALNLDFQIISVIENMVDNQEFCDMFHLPVGMYGFHACVVGYAKNSSGRNARCTSEVHFEA